jgi:hypothetical protein
VRKLFIFILIVLAVYLVWRWRRSDVAALDRGQTLVFDRLWVDHLPTSETDPAQVFAAVTEQPIGIFQRASMWSGAWELFRYQAPGDGQIVLLYPQSGAKERAGYRATRCQEKGFDFCLELSGASRGTRRYYSQKGWEIGAARTPAELETRVETLLHHAR